MRKKFKSKANQFVCRAVTLLTVLVTLLPTSLALLLSGGGVAGAADSIKIGYNANDAVYYIGDSSDPYYVFCMNIDLHWPRYEGKDHDYTEIKPEYTADYFNTKADYENFKKNETTFWKRLKAILIMGYSNNALGLFQIENSGSRIDVDRFNAKLVPTDWLRSDFPTIIGDKVFTYDASSQKVNYADAVSDFVMKVSELYKSKGTTASGHTYEDIIGTDFYKACQLLNFDPLDYSTHTAFFQDSNVITGKTAANETQNAVWELYKEYGFKYNEKNPVSLGTIGKEIYEKAKTLDFLEEAPNESKVSLTGDATFTYKNGRWETGTLKVNEPSDYHGQYTLTLPSGVTTDSGTTKVAGNTEFKLISATEPPKSGTISATSDLLYLTNFHLFEPTNETEKTEFQSMVGAKFGKKRVTASTSYSVKSTAGLKVYKYVTGADGKADTSKPVKGVKFKVTYPDKTTKEITTNISGVASLSGLEPGEYTVEEVSVDGANPKVVLPSKESDRIKKVTVKASNTDDNAASVTFSDEGYESALKIYKYVKGADGKADTSQPVKGVKFKVTYPDKTTKEVETGEEGTATLTGLAPGEYTVEESSVEDSDPVVVLPDASDRTQKVTVTAKNTASSPAKATFSDESDDGQLTITKVDSDDYTKTLPGASFKLEKLSGSTWKEVSASSVSSAATLTTDSKGQLDLSKLAKNAVYRLTETSAPAGYMVNSQPYYLVWLGGKKTADSVYASLPAAINKEIGAQSKIRFFTEAEGSLYVPNAATDLTVTKKWLNSDGSESSKAGASSVKVNLYKQTTDGVNVKLYMTDASGKTTGKDYSVKKGTKIGFSWASSLYSVIVNGEEQKLASGAKTFTSDKLDENTTIVVKSSGDLGDPEVTKTDATVASDKTLVDTVSLSDADNWQYTWSKLARQDENGNNLLYTVKEEAVSGYITSYSNNDGIASGEITIKNKQKSNIDYTLPATGGPGLYLYLLIGLGTVICGFALGRKFKFLKKQ